MITKMQIYLDLLNYVMKHGKKKKDRTGVGTKSIFGYQLRFNLQDGFPLLTTKKLHIRSIIYELLWFLRGDTTLSYLHEHQVTIWDEWANDKGELGPIYGKQWRAFGFPPVDQIKNVLHSIKNNPESRRHIVSAWNPVDIQLMALPPCHCLFQFYVEDDTLSCQMYQRSADLFLGVPFNIASYALLTHMIAQVSNLKVGYFIHTFGDAHIYLDHINQVNEQLKRTPRALPKLICNPQVTDLFSFRFEDFSITEYNPYPSIKAPIAI